MTVNRPLVEVKEIPETIRTRWNWGPTRTETHLRPQKKAETRKLAYPAAAPLWQNRG
jgi:hypothetical protein